MKSLANFFLYNNFVPLAFGILFLGGAGALAASPDARDAVFEATEVVRSVDNSFILSADVGNYPYDIEIVAVTEDDEQFYVEYALSTVDLEDYVWRALTKKKVLQVAKASVAREGLAQVVSLELTQVREAERARLVETQKIERTLGASQKVVATEFSGLIGSLVPPREEVVEFVPYTAPETSSPDTNSSGGGATATDSGSGPTITIFGNNPAQIAKGATYADLGVLALFNGLDTVSLHTYVDGKEVRSIVLDTSRDVTYTITYEAFAPNGTVARATRTVIVGAGTLPEEPTAAAPVATSSPETSVASSTPDGDTSTSSPEISAP